ncbi:3-deoxy-D-manno-octulosonic acid transferase [Gillisia sp. Hel_I_29]|uniref:3-deoxy-D-manno-octulosonic acid transferase n=1 Tax=Gillisia sp. Hel_I_29 TaxID=1249975 RepID=UPI000556A081|nr:glycosyltransferase N-terminal domain-containing protein [Gillisia sp. Hel_I_29]
MKLAYNILIEIIKSLLPITSIFSEKMKLFVNGRKETFSILKDKIKSNDAVIWFHAASLGEFEQGLPIIEIVKDLYPSHKIVVSFFSPSGYEIKKNSNVADAIVYLPLDTAANANQFLDLAHPDLVFFIKYEFWPNYLSELKDRGIRTLLISGGFREDMVFFKAYGKWMIKYLETFEHFFVQNLRSKELLNSIGFNNVNVSGDTRFDRVAKQLSHNNKLDFIETFKADKSCVVAGSTWPEDELMLHELINNSSANVKFIIAPHQIKANQIASFRSKLTKKTLLFSEKNNKAIQDYDVFIIDTIGLLSKIYHYADIAYVGGAAGNTGLHNILEPATFGIPIIIGKNFNKFPEAVQLKELQGLYSVSDTEDFTLIVNKLLCDQAFRAETGRISKSYIQENIGATEMVRKYLKNTALKTHEM